jgi:hypothetical protein
LTQNFVFSFEERSVAGTEEPPKQAAITHKSRSAPDTFLKYKRESILKHTSPSSQDASRYTAARGQHKLLKQAEIARATVKKLGALADSLLKSADAWEKEHGRPFFYDTQRVTDMVEEYKWKAQQAEEAKRQQKVRVWEMGLRFERKGLRRIWDGLQWVRIVGTTASRVKRRVGTCKGLRKFLCSSGRR